jgi:hypothetical protein
MLSTTNQCHERNPAARESGVGGQLRCAGSNRQTKTAERFSTGVAPVLDVWGQRLQAHSFVHALA